MLDRLRALLPDDAIEAGTTAAATGIDARLIVHPESAAEAAAVLELCSREGWTAMPVGAGGWLDAGYPPAAVDVLLSTRRFASIVEYEPADLTVGVGAGLSLDVLQSRLAEQRQTLPLDPPARSGATLGAIAATASAGPLRHAAGQPRDLILGLQLITGDGRILDVGGRVVKNVAGYDLVRLAVGSAGTLGLVTRVHFRLRPLPERDLTLAFVGDAPIPLADRALDIARTHAPAAVELLCPLLARKTLLVDSGWGLVVRLTGATDVVEEAAQQIRREALRGTNEVPSPEAFWVAAGRLEAEDALSFRLASLPTALPHTLALGVAIAAGRPGGVHGNFRSDKQLLDVPPGWLVAAHAADGIVRIWHPDPHGAERTPATLVALGAARTALREQEGTARLMRAPRHLAEQPEAWAEVPGRSLMRGLRRVFDPAGILPDRFGWERGHVA